MIVADVNLVVYLLTENPWRDAAVRVWQGDPDWAMPPLWRHEFLNVLATLVRREFLEREQAVRLWHDAVSLFGPTEMEPDMEKALALACEYEVSAYDAQYVVLADRLGCRLVTGDQKLARLFPHKVMPLARAAGA